MTGSGRVRAGVGFGKPPPATQFKKGRSGNPRGRPRGRRRELPHDHLLGQIVTVREDGRERRVTAAEAFLLHLTKLGLDGDSAAARATLAAIETARAGRSPGVADGLRIVMKGVEPGSVGTAVEDLGLAVMRKRYTEAAKLLLKPWIVEQAIERLGEVSLTAEQQRVVLAATDMPAKVRWPHWWIAQT